MLEAHPLVANAEVVLVGQTVQKFLALVIEVVGEDSLVGVLVDDGVDDSTHLIYFLSFGGVFLSLSELIITQSR